jgi:hypothetical protein
MFVGMKLTRTSKHKQDEAKRQNQHHFVTGLELAKGGSNWLRIEIREVIETPPLTSQWGDSIADRQVNLSVAFNNRDK